MSGLEFHLKNPLQLFFEVLVDANLSGLVLFYHSTQEKKKHLDKAGIKHIILRASLGIIIQVAKKNF